MVFYWYYCSFILQRAYKIKISQLKTIVDLSCLTASGIITFIFFGEIKGIDWGTLVMAILNGSVIGLFSRLLNKLFNFLPIFPKFSALFELQPPP